MALDFLRDCTLVGPALPEPFVRFELESELSKAGLLPKSVGAEGRLLQESWVVYRRKLRELVRGGSIRVRNHVIEPLVERLGYARLESAEEVETREGAEEGGDLLVSGDGSARLRVWCTEFDEDLEAPSRRGAAYRYSYIRIAQRVLLARGERLGLVTNGTELRILISDPARPDSQIVVHIDPAWKDKRSYEAPDSYRLVLALATPNGVAAIAALVDKARLKQTRVTKELRKQARTAVEGFLQEVLDHPENQARLLELKRRPDLARELWREALIVVYRLLFILKLEATDDPARSFSFASTSLWRNTFSPSVALPRFVRALLDHGSPTGRLLEDAVRGLFRMFVEGLDCTELHVKPLGGTLFGENVTPLLSAKELHWGERGVALLLDQLLWTSPNRSSEGRERVHYGSLDVEDLGRVYEALLELEPGIAAEPMCRLRRAKIEAVVPIAQGEKYRPAETTPFAEADDEEETEEEIEEEEEPIRGRKTKVEWIEEIRPGHFYLRVGLGRKSTGSYYTPHSFVRFLVQETLGPLVNDRSPKDDPQPAEILKLKVLDPAMGSGHFLVEACRFLGARLYEAARLCDERLARYEKTASAAQNDKIKAEAEAEVANYRRRLQAFLPPDAELLAYLPSRSPEASESGLSQKRAEAICRRLVAIHCLYGVDKNALAVELAKVALWIESHSEGLPLTFVNHRLLLGDSLTGPFLQQLLSSPGSKHPIEDLYTQELPQSFSEAAGQGISWVHEIERTLGATVGDVETKEEHRRRLRSALAPFNIVAAAWVGGAMLGPEACDDGEYKWLLASVAHNSKLPADLSDHARLLEMIALGLGVNKVPGDSRELVDLLDTDSVVPALPYELAFPEVFFPTGDISVRSAFHTVIGNPPWERVKLERKEFFVQFDMELMEIDRKSIWSVRTEHILNTDGLARAAWEKIEHERRLQKNLLDHLYEQFPVPDDIPLITSPKDLFRYFAERFDQLQQGYSGMLLGAGFMKSSAVNRLRYHLFVTRKPIWALHFKNSREVLDLPRIIEFSGYVGKKDRDARPCSVGWNLEDVPTDFTSANLLSWMDADILKTEPLVVLSAEAFNSRATPRGISLQDLSRTLGVEFGVELQRTDDTGMFRLADLGFTPDADARLNEVWPSLLDNGYVPIRSSMSMRAYDDVPQYVGGAWRPEVTTAITIREGRGMKLLPRLPFYRLAIRCTCGSPQSNERSLVATMLAQPCICGASIMIEAKPRHRPNSNALTMMALLNSYVPDALIRPRINQHVTKALLGATAAPEIRPNELMAHSALRLVCNHDGFAPLWREQLEGVWREARAGQSWPVLVSDDERWAVRACIDAFVAHSYRLSREQYQEMLTSFTHRAYPSAPELCLDRFDELSSIGTGEFVRKYDPYWDIPLNEGFPHSLVDSPLSAHPEAQGTLALKDARLPANHDPRSPRASVDNEVDPAEYDRVRHFLVGRREVASSEIQSALGFDSPHTRRVLKQLVEDGLLVVQGSGRATRYVVRREAAHGHTAT